MKESDENEEMPGLVECNDEETMNSNIWRRSSPNLNFTFCRRCATNASLALKNSNIFKYGFYRLGVCCRQMPTVLIFNPLNMHKTMLAGKIKLSNHDRRRLLLEIRNSK